MMMAEAPAMMMEDKPANNDKNADEKTGMLGGLGGMGKLGGMELNVSSDIDLIFVYAEDGQLRRSDGSSVYTVTGSQLFTSPELLAAEARIVARAGRHFA